jgi:hypothetical protein
MNFKTICIDCNKLTDLPDFYSNVVDDLLSLLKYFCLQNWFDANSACASVGGRLPTILSAEDNSLVTSLVKVSKMTTKH